MERQRVVHYARSRTAKVIRPAYTNYAGSPTTSSEPSQAPLASIDSDFVIITKRRDETNMAPNLWSHINTNSPQTNFILQNIGEHSGIFDTDENYGEQNDYSPPRTYIKLRASQNPSLNNACEKLHSPSPQGIPQGHVTKNIYKTLNVASNSGRLLPAEINHTQSTCNTKASSRTEIIYHTNGSYVEQLINGRDNHSSGGFSNHMNGYTEDNIKYIVESATIKENAVVDSKIKQSVCSQDLPKVNDISDHSSLNSQTCLSSSPEPEYDVAENSSPIDSCSDGNFTNLDITLKVNPQGFPNTDRTGTYYSERSCFSKGNHPPQTESSVISKTANQSSDCRVDKILAVDCRRGGEQMQPEVCGISPSEYTSDIRLASERIAQMYTKRVPHSRHSHHYCSIYVPSNPRSSVHNSSVKTQQDRANFQSSLPRDVRRVNAINQNSRPHDITDIKHINSLKTAHSSNIKHTRTSSTTQSNNVKHTRISTTTHTNNVKHTRTSATTPFDQVKHTRTSATTPFDQVKHTRTCSTIHSDQVKHARTSPTTHSNNALRHDTAACWKRSSLRHATHGYSSISELTVSMENLLGANQSEIHTSANIPYLKPGVDRSNRAHSMNVLHRSCSDDKPTGGFGQDVMCGRYDSSTAENSSCTSVETNTTQALREDGDFHGSKRMSYKLATSDSSYELLSKTANCHVTNSGNNKYIHINKSNSLCSDRSYARIEHPTLVTSGHTVGRDTNGEVWGQRQNQLSVLDTYDEEKMRSLKRRSFKLATSSLSDLTFLDDSAESGFSVDRHSSRTVGDLEFRDVSGESVDSSLFYTQDGRHQRARDDSFSSGRLNSSFGSFYSCQSRDLQLSVDASSKHTQLKLGQNQKRSLPALQRSSFRETVGSESSFSGDSSAYYTASDNSCPTPDGDSGTHPYADLLQPPSRMTMFAQRQKSSANRHQRMTQSKSSLNNISFRASTLPHNVKSAKYYNQSGVFRCYGCGVNDKFSIQGQHRGRKPSARLESSRSRIWVNPDYVHGRPLDYRNRSRSAPASRCATSRQSEASSRKLIPVKAQMYLEPGPRVSVAACSISAPNHGSSATAFIDPTWHTMPRIPPSLGRPRRKLYAGFDSQPLPMDSFLSDSSSVYSTQSCSSWGTSRSAMVESCSRTPDLLSKARSTSSIASSLITPTRPATHDDVFDFFTYTDKRSSVCENSHNLYLSRENSYPDDCYKDAFYDMTYSKESLESFLSDGTTVNADHDISPEYSLGYEKPRFNSFSGSTDLQNNKRAVLENLKQSKQNNQLEIVHNRSIVEMQSSASLENRKNQLKTTKGSAPDGSGKPKFLPKRKYFSTKDIFDLVMSSDRNYKDTKGRSRSLERQAQKVCETIMCLT